MSLDGGDKLAAKLRKIEQQIMREADKALAATAADIHRNAIESINNITGGGNIYTRRSVTHKASAAGDPPNSDTGNLVRSITFERIAPLEYTVGSNSAAAYGRMLEFGTSNIAPRPWLQPAIDKNKPKLQQRLADVINKVIKANSNG